MRHQSVQTVSSNHFNRMEKEKVMRKSVIAVTALVVLLTAATPAMAVPRENREVPAVTKLVRIIKKVFGISTQAEPSIPIPGPTNDQP